MCISEIAVMAGSDGRTVPLNEPGTVIVYRWNRGAWQEVRTLPFALDEESGLAGLRRKMTELNNFLGGCRTFVTASACGAVFFELEKAGCTVWVVPGSPEDFLDAIRRDVTADLEEDFLLSAGDSIPAPVEIAFGRFTISIKEIQGNHPEVSSRMVLQEFIRTGAFIELEIVCDHVPPWIEVEAERLGIAIETGYSGPHEMRVVLKKPDEGVCC